MNQFDYQQTNQDFQTILTNKTLINYFSQFLKKEFSDENLEFWLKCEQFKKIRNHKERKRFAKHIYETYMSVNACNAINISRNISEIVFNSLTNPSQTLFDFSQKQIFNLMKYDCFPRFLNSDIYKQYMDRKLNKNCADLRLESESKDLSEESKPMIKPRRRSLIPWYRIKTNRSQKTDNNQTFYDSSNNKKYKCETIRNANTSTTRKHCSCDNDYCDYCEKCEFSNRSQITEKVKIGQILQKLIKTDRPDKPTLTPNIIFSDDTKSDAFFQNIMLSSQHIPINESLCSFSPNPIVVPKHSNRDFESAKQHFTLSKNYDSSQTIINDIDLDSIRNSLKHFHSNTNISETDSTLTASQLYPNELSIESDFLNNSIAINKTKITNKWKSTSKLALESTPPPLPPKAIKTRAPPRPLVNKRFQNSVQYYK